MSITDTCNSTLTPQASVIEYVPIAVVTVQLFPSAHKYHKTDRSVLQTTPHTPTDLLEGVGSYLRFKNLVIKDASASPGQTSTTPCPASVSYQTHPLYKLWHSTAVNILWGSEVTRQRMPLNAMQWNGAPSFKMCLFSWATDASIQNQQFEVDMHQNSYLLLLRLAYHRVQQFWLTFCLRLFTGTAVFARASAHTGVWHFENVKFYPHEKNMPRKGNLVAQPCSKSPKSKATGGGSFTRSSRPAINFLSLL